MSFVYVQFVYMFDYAVLREVNAILVEGCGFYKGGEGAWCSDGAALFFEILIKNIAFLICVSNEDALLEDGGDDRGDVFVQ